MKEKLADGQLLPALKHCSNFLNDMRTSLLSPKEYYELYITVYDALEILSAHLLQSHNSKAAKSKDTPFLTDLYELVQYSGNIVPRLYMMIVVGTTYMLTKDASTKEIMKDMIEMCRGVQHPIRGLFLRNYLTQRAKDHFPLSTREDFDETVDFLIVNFIEMNKLWVRLQHQGHLSERETRYQERKELKILVGSNLVRLSQVMDDFKGDEHYLAADFYHQKIFPVIVEQIVQSHDHLAQTYLIDVLIQIFPDSYHFLTLKNLLNDVFPKLHPVLKKSELIATLVDRFVTYLKFESDLQSATDGTDHLQLQDDEEPRKRTYIPADDIFEAFWEFFDNLSKGPTSLPLDEYVPILLSLIRLSLALTQNNIAVLTKIYQLANTALAQGSSETPLNLWADLMVSPLEGLDSVQDLLGVASYYELFSNPKLQPYQKEISLGLVAKLLLQNNLKLLATIEHIDDAFRYFTPLLGFKNEPSTSKDLGVTKTVQIGNQHVSIENLKYLEDVSKVLHLVRAEDETRTISNLLYVKKKYLNKVPENIVYTYPTLAAILTNMIRLAGYKHLQRKAADSSLLDSSLTSAFKNIALVAEELYQHHQQFHLELVLKIYLNLATVADQLQQQTIAYELFTQCFVVYEESLATGLVQNTAISSHETMGGSASYQYIVMISNRLAQLRYFSKESYENLITKVTLYGSKLLKKQDQCRAVYYCSHLWWWCDSLSGELSPTVDGTDVDNLDSGNSLLYRDARRVLECLQKSLRVADSSMDPYLLLKLFVEILNRCLVFHVYGNWLVDLKYLNGLIDLIRTNLANLTDENSRGSEDQEAKLLRQIGDYFERTLDYVRNQQHLEEQFEDVLV